MHPVHGQCTGKLLLFFFFSSPGATLESLFHLELLSLLSLLFFVFLLFFIWHWTPGGVAQAISRNSGLVFYGCWLLLFLFCKFWLLFLFFTKSSIFFSRQVLLVLFCHSFFWYKATPSEKLAECCFVFSFVFYKLIVVSGCGIGHLPGRCRTPPWDTRSNIQETRAVVLFFCLAPDCFSFLFPQVDCSFCCSGLHWLLHRLIVA